MIEINYYFMPWIDALEIRYFVTPMTITCDSLFPNERTEEKGEANTQQSKKIQLIKLLEIRKFNC